MSRNRRLGLVGTALVVSLCWPVGAGAQQPAASPSGPQPGGAPTGRAPASPAEGVSGEGAPPEAEPAAVSDEPAVGQARDAFRLGSALAKQGQWNEALAAFQRSEKLRSHPVTGFNIGYVERALGHLTRARAWFRTSLEDSPNGALPPQLRGEAQAYLAEVDKKIARLVVTLEPNTAVAVDGRPLETTEGASGRPLLVAGTAPAGAGVDPELMRFDLIVDPGNHVIVLSREGMPDTVLNEQFEPGASRALDLRMQRSAAPAPAAAPAPVAAPAPAPEADAGEEPSSNAPYMWTAYGIGAAGLVVGSVFGILALDKKGTIDDEANCDSDHQNCDSAYDDDISAMQTFAPIADVGFIVGGLGVAIGTYFLITEPTPADSARSGVTLGASVGPGSVMLSGTY